MLDQSGARLTGIVTDSFEAKRNGFIEDTEGRNYFFHANYVRGRRMPAKGARVDFATMPPSRRGENARAIDVRVV